MTDFENMCKDCRYWRAANGQDKYFKFCHYCVDTGHLRGKQEPGQCDKKELGKKRKIVRPVTGYKKSKVEFRDVAVSGKENKSKKKTCNTSGYKKSKRAGAK